MTGMATRLSADSLTPTAGSPPMKADSASYRESPAVFWLDDLELAVDDTLDSGGLAAKRPELSESLHPRRVVPAWCGRAAREFLLQGLSDKGSEGLSAPSRFRLDRRNTESGISSVVFASPYSHIHGYVHVGGVSGNESANGEPA